MNNSGYTSHAAIRGRLDYLQVWGTMSSQKPSSSPCSVISQEGLGLGEEEEAEEQRKALMVPVSPLCQDPRWGRGPWSSDLSLAEPMHSQNVPWPWCEGACRAKLCPQKYIQAALGETSPRSWVRRTRTLFPSPPSPKDQTPGRSLLPQTPILPSGGYSPRRIRG